MALNSLSNIEAEIDRWITQSTASFSTDFVEGGKIWVLKFIDARFLSGFLASGQLVISTTPGFTWGDGVYVAPIRNEYSTMMYGRIGVLGWIAAADVPRVYDGVDLKGIGLYQDWIQHQRTLYRQLTTTIHADQANRLLRNAFRRKFAVDIVFFLPDQHNHSYVNAWKDRWLLVSDWSAASSVAPGSRPQYSSRIRQCRWVAVVEEQFEPSPSKVYYADLIGPCLNRPGLSRTPLQAQLRAAHAANAGVKPATLVRVKA